LSGSFPAGSNCFYIAVANPSQAWSIPYGAGVVSDGSIQCPLPCIGSAGQTIVAHVITPCYGVDQSATQVTTTC